MYDKFNASKELKDCMLSVELRTGPVNLATILPVDFIPNKDKLLHSILFGCKSNADVCAMAHKYMSRRFELTSAYQSLVEYHYSLS